MIIKIFRGDTQTIDGVVRNQDGDTIDITGATVRMSVKKLPTDSAFVLTRTAVLTDAQNGGFSIRLTSNDTNLPAREYVFDVELTFTSPSRVHTLAKGTLIIMSDITV